MRQSFSRSKVYVIRQKCTNVCIRRHKRISSGIILSCLLFCLLYMMPPSRLLVFGVSVGHSYLASRTRYLFATVATIARKIITQEARTHHVNIWRRFSLKTLANKSLLMKSITGCPFWDYGFSPLGTLLEIRQYLSYRAWATCGWSGAAHFSQTCSQRPINSLNSQKRIPRNIVTIRRFNGKQAEEMFLLR